MKNKFQSLRIDYLSVNSNKNQRKNHMLLRFVTNLEILIIKNKNKKIVQFIVSIRSNVGVLSSSITVHFTKT